MECVGDCVGLFEGMRLGLEDVGELDMGDKVGELERGDDVGDADGLLVGELDDLQSSMTT